MSNFVQRTLSGAVYVAVVVLSILAAILWDTSVVFALLFCMVTVLAVCEYHRLMHSDRFLTCAAAVAGALLFLTIALFWGSARCWNEEGSDICIGLSVLCIIVHVAIVFLTLLSELFRKAENPIANWGNLLVSQVMIALPFALMPLVLCMNPYYMLALFVLIWLNDSGAYCVGSLLAKRPGGNHKMFPRVSPGKSWEGLIGGVVVAVAASMLLAYLGWFDGTVLNPYVTAALFAITVAVFGTLGDLMESLMKRTIGVKDSGRFMPGHGGVLDRFDSILLATPAICLFLLFVNMAGK